MKKLLLYLFFFTAMMLFFSINMSTYKNFGGEDITLHNASYTISKYNKVAYPIYDSYNPGNWDSMWVHPPIHYISLGLIMKIFEESFALSFYYSFWFLLLLVSLANLKIDISTKVLIVVSVLLYFVIINSNFIGLSFRPEVIIGLQFMTGLSFLEVGRTKSLNKIWLTTGTFIILFAAFSHFFALFMVLSALLYWFIIFSKSDFSIYRFLKEFKIPLVILISLTVLYLIIFVLPNFRQIYDWTIGTQRMHAQEHGYSNPFNIFIQHIETYGFTFGIFASIILTFHKKLRTIGIASLLFFVYATFFQNVKKDYYAYPELLFFTVSIFILFSYLIEKIMKKYFSIVIIFLIICMISITIFHFNQKNWKVHPLNIVREWSLQKIKTNSSISGRHGLWYISGAQKWYNEEDGFWKTKLREPNKYIDNVDYIAVHPMLDYESPDNRFEGLFVENKLNLISAYFTPQPFVLYSSKEKTDEINVLIFNNGSFLEGTLDSAGDYLFIAYKFIENKDSFDLKPSFDRFDMSTGLRNNLGEKKFISFGIYPFSYNIPKKNIISYQRISLNKLKKGKFIFFKNPSQKRIEFYKSQIDLLTGNTIYK